MENPLEVQRSLYGEDGPPMVFRPEPSALHLEMRAPPSPRACAATDREIPRKAKRKAPSAGEVFAKAVELRASYSPHHASIPGNGPKQPSPCQLPGDFPPELSFRSLAAYSLLRTLSIQLRLSPFTPNAFLRALALPAPNKLLGDVHVALLRILFVQKLKNMGYSYKPGGGGVGVTKKRQIDGIRWPLLAGDNLTHLDGYSWPLFYDDYCHLTADRLWESYHGPLEDEGMDDQNFIDFRNIGVFVPPRGEEYKTKIQADDYGLSSGTQGDECRGANTTSTIDKVKSETAVVEMKSESQLPLPIPSSSIGENRVEVTEDVAMLNSDKSDSEEEYQVGEDDDDDDEAWEKPKRKKRRRTPKKNAPVTPTLLTTAQSNDQQKVSSVLQSTQSIEKLPSQSQVVSSTNVTMPSVSTLTQIPNVEKPLQENPPSKPIEAKVEADSSEQQKEEQSLPLQLHMVLSTNESMKDKANKSIEPNEKTNVPKPPQQEHGEQQKLPPQSQIVSSANENVPSVSSVTETQIPKIEKPPQEDKSSKPIGLKPETTVSEQPHDEQQKLLLQAQTVLSPKESVRSIPTTTQIPQVETPMEEASKKSIESLLETNVSGQTQQQKDQEQKEDTKIGKEAPKSDDIIPNIDPARIRGGGILDSQGGSGRPSMGRPRGSRRALPMSSNRSTPQPSIYPAHAQQTFQQQQQYLLYQNHLAQITQRYSLHQYPTATAVVSNEKLKLHSGVQSSFQIDSEQLDKPFKVTDATAKAVNDVIRGSSVQELKIEDILEVHDVKKENDDGESVTVDPAFEEKLEMERWKHFKPLKAMRSGLPYHRLSIEEKICILEFLTDELLTVDAIAAEFTKREIQGEHRTSSYGTLPKEHEYQNMENRDECAVCGQEGDLMCCDGCLSSYHACCLGMKEGEELPEGKWLCPECSLVDPSNYGSLHGGQNASLDWFSLDKITKPSSLMQQSNPYGSMVPPQFSMGVPNAVSDLQNISMIQNSTAQVPSAAEELQIKAQPESTEKSKKWKDKEFLVVHGFVFCRDSTEGNAALEALKTSKPYVALTKPELETFASQTDDALLQAWPLAQIPFNTKPTGSWKFPSVKNYFSRKEAIDPFRYNNRYYRSPVSLVAKCGAINNMTKLMYLTYESECDKPNTSKLSEVLTQDFSLDAEISACLKIQAGLFDPFQFLKGYMLKLEHTLKRSCLLTEFWEGGTFRSRSDVWTHRVREAQSIRALCRLLLKLVNAMHTRAFSTSWFHSHVSKGSEIDGSTSERHYEPLPSDWSEEKEKLRRKWETTPSKMILSLCTDFDNELMGFASKVRSDIFIPKKGYTRRVSKRKLKKAASISNFKKRKEIDDKLEAEKIIGSSEQLGANEHDHENSCDPIDAKQEEQQQISNLSNAVEGNMDVDRPREALRDPAVISQLETQKIRINQEDPMSSNPLLTSKEVPDAPNVPSSIHSEPIEAKKEADYSLDEIASNDRKGENDQIIEGRTDDQNQNDSSQTPPRPTENNIQQQEGVSGAPESCTGASMATANEMEKNATPTIELQEDAKLSSTMPEGSEEPKKSIPVSKSLEENPDVRAEREDVSISIPKVKEDKDTATTSDTADGNPTPKAASKKKRKKSPKSVPREPSTRRRTRHSDRLSSDHLVGNSKVTNASELKESAQFEALEGMALQLENAKKQKIPGLEKLLKGQYAIEGIWPIAGRRIFPTIGNIPPTEMKRIARNAGSTIAANLSYHTNHEVAQVCYGHIWRKRVHQCNRFEELLHLLRTLESSLDRSMIHQCENQTRRGKSSLQKVIRCSIRNPSSGLLDHFLVNKKSLKGCWVPSDQLDLSSLILDLFCRRQRQKEERMERVRTKERMEKELLERQRQVRMAEAAKKAQEEKIRKEEARRVAKIRKQEEALKRKLGDETRKNARVLATNGSQHDQNDNTQALRIQIAAVRRKLQLIFESYEMQTEKALRYFDRAMNFADIPESERAKMRKKVLEKVRFINDALQQVNEPVMSNEQIMSRIIAHEKNADMKFRGPNNTRTSTGNSQNINANTYSQTKNRNFQNESGNMFSQNIAQKTPSMFGNEQNRKQAFGNGNFAQTSNPNHPNVGQNMFSPEPLMRQKILSPESMTPQMQSSQNNRNFMSRGNGLFDGTKGLRNSLGRGDTMNQPQGQLPQQGNFQNQTQVDQSGSRYYSTPNSKKNQFFGPSPGGNMFSNKQHNSVPNQTSNAMSQPNLFPNSLSPLQFAQLQPQQQSQQKQHGMNANSFSPLPLRQQPQQHQNYHVDFSNGQVQTQNQFSHSGYQNANNNAQPSRSNSVQQQYPNNSFNQKGSTMDYRRQQMGLNQQHYSANTAQTASQLNNPNNGSISNPWNNPNSVPNQYNNLSQQSPSSFAGHVGVRQQQQQNNRQQQMHNRNYATNGTNLSIPTMNMNSFQGESSMPGQFGDLTPNKVIPVSQPNSNSRQPFNMGYGQPGNNMSQNGGNMFPGQQQQEKQKNFGPNRNFPYNMNGSNQMGGQSRQQPMSTAPAMQHHDFRQSTGQQQISQSQSSQQQPQQQLETIQRQIYMLQQQQKQQQQQYQTPNGQFNPGQNGNFYR